MKEKERTSREHSIIDSKIKALRKTNKDKWWTWVYLKATVPSLSELRKNQYMDVSMIRMIHLPLIRPFF